MTKRLGSLAPISQTAAVLLFTSILSGCAGGGGGGSGAEGNNGTASQTYSLSGTVSGLTVSGLVLMVDGADMSVPANTASEEFTAGLAAGASYSITVDTQPSGETCTVTNGTGIIGTADVGNVVVTCSDQAYPLGGSISGLNGSGLVLSNGSDTLSVTPGTTSFTLPTQVAYTSSYSVMVQTQPQGEACSVSNGSGTMPTSAVTNVSVSCTDQPFTVGGTISGLGNNTGLVLADGSDTLNVQASSTSFTMPTGVDFGNTYTLVVQSVPPGLACAAANASGTMPATNVTNIAITCSDQSYTLGGTISGLAAGGLVLANGSDTLTVPANSPSFTMPTAVPYGGAYTLVVQTQPTGETCSVASGSGTMPASNVTNVAVSCSVNTYTIGGAIAGLTATGLVLLDNGGDSTSIAANATQFTMNTGVAYGSSYEITVGAQPTGETCSVSNAAANSVTANVAGVNVTCTAATYTIGGTIAGLTASGLVLLDAGGDSTSIAANATQFTMNTSVAYGGSYAITVQSQPLAETCSVANGSGGAVAANFTGVSITCQSFQTSVLYSFSGGKDGSWPTALVYGSDGNLYGTTGNAGSNGHGAVFQVTPSGAETTLYAFVGTYDGASPTGLFQGPDGNFYGVTYSGGSPQNLGVVFVVTPTGTETTLRSFNGSISNDGANPSGSLIYASNGVFYGVTYDGGAANQGTVFSIMSGGAYTVLYSFTGSVYGGADGANPLAGLVQGNDGNFYGTTWVGGIVNLGTVFMISPSGTEVRLHSFSGGAYDGSLPQAGLIQGTDGAFYGTTSNGGAYGGGVVFKITPGGSESVLYNFGGGSDGATPEAALIRGVDGNFYGTTRSGGVYRLGTVYMITPGGVEKVLHSFGGGPGDGATPAGPLVLAVDGSFYGTTTAGGATGNGTIFKMAVQ